MFPRDKNNYEMENQLGKSIVKASIILSVAIILCMAIYVTNNPNRYTSIGNSYYIDQRSGIVYSYDGILMNRK
jgi:hypothetical protein